MAEEKTFKKNPPLYHLANAMFQLKSLCGAGSIAVVKDVDPKLINLDGVLMCYQGSPKLYERVAARHISHEGGQGIKRCNCRGICLNKQCSCFKAGGKCTPHCHKSNDNYQNG